MISSLGKLLVVIGLGLAVVGAILMLAGRSGLVRSLWERFPLGRLPGDISLRGEGFSFYFPWVTCLVVSIVLTLLLSFFRK